MVPPVHAVASHHLRVLSSRTLASLEDDANSKIPLSVSAVVGSVGLYPIDRPTCELRKMYLHSAFRGKGLGRHLLDHALKRAKELGFSRVTLETASVLKEAIALYQSYGFRPYAPDHLAGRCDQAHFLDLG